MSFSDGKHWHMDEEEYLRLRSEPDVQVEQCPACEKIERQMYDGEIVLQGGWMVDNKEEILNFVHNEESRAMRTNPMARLASLEDRGRLDLHPHHQFGAGEANRRRYRERFQWGVGASEAAVRGLRSSQMAPGQRRGLPSPTSRAGVLGKLAKACPGRASS